MDWLTNTVRLDVEVTSHCNAACPGCERNINGGKVNPKLELGHMSMETWENLLKGFRRTPLYRLELNGNVGDFIMHPNILEMLDIFCKQHPRTIISAQTNGAARNETFWKDLAYITRNNNLDIGFAIDGISNEMNHIHRRNAKFDLAIRNAKAFISNGGTAYWVYTMFDHNIDHLKTARKIANETGFIRITYRNSCIPSEDLVVNTEKEKYQIGTSLADNFPERHIKFENNKTKDFQKNALPDEYTSYENFSTYCQAYHARKINVDWKGHIYPCSYIYAENAMMQNNIVRIKDTEVQNREVTYTEFDADNININKNSLENILGGEWFRSLEKSIKKEEYAACNRFCVVNRIKEIDFV